MATHEITFNKPKKIIPTPEGEWVNSLQTINDILATDKSLWGSKLGTALGICTEAGELADIVRKLEGDKKIKESDDLTNMKRKLEDEIADVMVYLFQLATLFNVDIDNAFRTKVEVIYSRTFKN